MKKLLFVIVMALAAFSFSACQKEKTQAVGSEDEIPTTYDMVHTSWKGVYSGYVQHPQAGPVPCELTWTLDFVDESNVSILLEMTTGGQAQQPQEMSCSYSFSGLTGELISMEDGEEQRDSFTVDPVNRTFTVNLAVYTGFSQEEPQMAGGPTTFHQIH